MLFVTSPANCWAESQAEGNSNRPNIIVVMADDMGFSDLGCYGGEIKTPTVDRLASDGVRFSQFYNCAICGTSRASLMTGSYPWRVGQAPGQSIFRNLTKNCVTVMQLLKAKEENIAPYRELYRQHDRKTLMEARLQRQTSSDGETGCGKVADEEIQNPLSQQDLVALCLAMAADDARRCQILAKARSSSPKNTLSAARSWRSQVELAKE